MGWKGAVRSFNAAARRIERGAIKQQNAMLREQKRYEKLREIALAADEVDKYNQELASLLSIHHFNSDPVDWHSLAAAAEPLAPVRSKEKEQRAQEKVSSYVPTFWQKLFRRVEKFRERLTAEVEKAKADDEAEFIKATNAFTKKHVEWKETLEFADRVLSKDPASLIEALEESEVFSDLAEHQVHVVPSIGKHGIDLIVQLPGKAIVPRQVKSQLKSGKLSMKDISPLKINEIYQDFVCGVALRSANDVFSMLPIAVVTINAYDNLLNPQTGHMERQIILSVAILRSTLQSINLENIDPSQAMENFVHHMTFKKGSGFEAVSPVALNNPDVV